MVVVLGGANLLSKLQNALVSKYVGESVFHVLVVTFAGAEGNRAVLTPFEL